MELGEKLRQARMEAGLSQRQLCGEEITRNMLSQIENGAAKPSMATLRYLAERLGKPLSWFLDEQAEQHSRLIEAHTLLDKAREAVNDGREIHAAELLEKVTDPNPDIQRRKLLLLAGVPGSDPVQICRKLPSLDEELLLRAKAALVQGTLERCRQLLEAAEDQENPDWNMLRGEVHLRQEAYAEAAICFHRAEEKYPRETASVLEQCYREMGDYQKAYFYACKQR